MNCYTCHAELPVANGVSICQKCGSLNMPTVIVGSNLAPTPLPKARTHHLIPTKLNAVIVALLIVAAGSLSTYAYASSHRPNVQSKTPTTKHTPVHPAATGSNTNSTSAPVTAAQSSPASAAKPIPSPTPVVSIPPAPNCIKSTSYKAASALSISSLSPGLKQVTEPNFYYTVYGYSANEIRSQLNACRPFVENGTGFDANTTWWINTSYSWQTTTNGGSNCRVQNVAVGLDIAVGYPHWNSTPYAENGLASRWQTYMNNLQTHENGHIALAQQYASNILNGLQAYPATACSSIGQQLSSYTDTKLASLKQAEQDYDTQTDHGATQGAVFP